MCWCVNFTRVLSIYWLICVSVFVCLSVGLSLWVCHCVTGEKEDEGEEKIRNLSSFQREKREREKKKPNWEMNKIIRYKVTITMHICTVTIASLDIHKVLQGLICVFFMLYCVNFCTFCILDPLMQLLLTYILNVLVYRLFLDKFYEK